MTDLQAEHRIQVALHEAAHLVASIACPNTSIHGVDIYAPFVSRDPWARGTDGRVRSCCLEPEHDAFVNFVGLAWEESHGDPRAAAADYKAGLSHSRAAAYPSGDGERKAEEIIAKARKFVLRAHEPINHAAVGLLGLLPKSGELSRARTAKLAAALRPLVPDHSRL